MLKQSEGLRCKACDSPLTGSDKELCTVCLERVQEDLHDLYPEHIDTEVDWQDLYVSDITGEILLGGVSVSNDSFPGDMSDD